LARGYRDPPPFPTRRSSDLANLGSLVATVAFNLVAIPHWGYVGAGYGYCAGSLVYLGLVYVSARSVMQVQVPWGFAAVIGAIVRSEEHTSELQSRSDLVCRL